MRNQLQKIKLPLHYFRNKNGAVCLIKKTKSYDVSTDHLTPTMITKQKPFYSKITKRIRVRVYIKMSCIQCERDVRT